MNDKVTLQAISDIFSGQYGISKKTADAFGKYFFDTIVEGLNKDGIVKIKGLGTFKIVNVGSRESVNVTNGKRFVIEGYRKVSFTPDELSEQKKAEQMQQVDAEVAATVNQSEEELKAQIEEALQSVGEEAEAEVSAQMLAGAEPEGVETPKDEFSGIDILISTPESVAELRKDVRDAQLRAEQAVRQAKEANVEYRRLQLLLERLENNQAVESLVKEIEKALNTTKSAPAAQPLMAAEEKAPIATEPLIPAEVAAPVVETAVPAEETVAPEEEAVAPVDEETPIEETPAPVEETAVVTTPTVKDTKQPLYSNKDDANDDDDEEDEQDHQYRTILTLLFVAILVLLGIAYYLMANKQADDDDKVQQTYILQERTEAEDQDKADSLLLDSIRKARAKASTEEEMAALDRKAERVRRAAENRYRYAKSEAKSEEEKKTEEVKKEEEKKTKVHRVHVLSAGEGIYQLSRKYYNTNDSAKAIIRLNKFTDPNNLPVGTKVILP